MPQADTFPDGDAAMYDIEDPDTRREIDKIGKKLLQNVVELALEEEYSHATITGGLIKQAYTILRLTSPLEPDQRKQLFLKMASEMADEVEKSTQARA